MTICRVLSFPPAARAAEISATSMLCVHISPEVECDMRMGNYLSVWRLPYHTMSATNDTFGIQHLTVVPTNFGSAATTDQPEPADDERDEAA